MAPPEAAAVGSEDAVAGGVADVLGAGAPVVEVHAASIVIASTAASLMHADNGRTRPPLRELELRPRIISPP